MGARHKDNPYLHLDVLEAWTRHPAAEQEPSRGPILCVTSSSPREGKTRVATTLACQLGVTAGPVLLIDNARAEHRSATALLAPEARLGWTNVVRDGVEPSKVIFRSVAEGLDLLPGPRSGSDEDRARALRDPAFRVLLESLRSRYRYLIADGPGLSDLPVGREFHTWSTGILLVLDYGKSSAVLAREYLARLEDVRDRFLGAIVNRRRYPIPRFLYRLL